MDFVVNAQALAQIYAATKTEDFSLSNYPGVRPRGEGRLFLDETALRMRVVEHLLLGDSWPAGDIEARGPFISSRGLNFPAYIAQFLS
jgi:hypothetical protein